jgi:hypothetical protein
VAGFLAPGHTSYTAAEVVERLLGRNAVVSHDEKTLLAVTA